jgi:hypothetical protein
MKLGQQEKSVHSLVELRELKEEDREDLARLFPDSVEGQGHQREEYILGTYIGPASQPLHIVNFRCCRSDVFYVQDGTGLQVNVGDLVIVEADRGTDLGIVQHINVTWDEAKRHREHYVEEHYKWLMMLLQ